MSKELGVVIPFYQRERGILARAIASALAQRDVQPDRIVVVDDGSPVSARDELADLLRGDESRIDVIEQSNAGTAAARNRGLNALSRLGVEYVAFADERDLVEKTRYYLDHDDARLEIAAAGRAKANQRYSAVRYWQLVLERMGVV